MLRQSGKVLLTAERDPVEAQQLAKALEVLAVRAVAARSSEDIVQLLRLEMFDRAMIATELNINGQPALTYLARLPSMSLLVGIGPSGDVNMEMRARSAGATIYLTRPITSAALARILKVDSRTRLRGPP